MTRFEPFLLDRLLDVGHTSDWHGVRLSQTLEQIKDSVARDLEALLNTRCGLKSDCVDAYREASRSIITFGLLDFVGLCLDSPHDCDRICQSIAQAIARHEPRLRAARVSLERREHGGLGLNFHIQALLVVNPAREPVSFDAVLQPSTQQYAVRKSRRIEPGA
jgi:type VI secretion system protein ImpF